MTIVGSVDVEVAGERLVLLRERAIYWPRMRTLLVADPHFGKDATFRVRGIPVPPGDVGLTLRALDIALDGTGATRLTFLGDLWHAREGRDHEVLASLDGWRRTRADLPISLVRGNHDPRAGGVEERLGIECFDGIVEAAPFVLAHRPGPHPSGYVLSGHLHPAVRMVGRGRESIRLPCFWFRAGVGVLPSFGPFTGHAVITPAAGDAVFAVIDDAVVPLSTSP